VQTEFFIFEVRDVDNHHFSQLGLAHFSSTSDAVDLSFDSGQSAIDASVELPIIEVTGFRLIPLLGHSIEDPRSWKLGHSLLLSALKILS